LRRGSRGGARRLAAGLALAGAALGIPLAHAPAALALGPGRACVFYYPFQGDLVGHVAWAFSVPGSSVWDYGSGDGAGAAGTGWNTRPVDQAVWVMNTASGFPDVASTFRARHYTAYVCKNTPTSSVGAAQNLALSDRSWDTFSNNCAEMASDILNTYYGGTFPIPYNASSSYGPNGDPLPIDWFNSLAGTGQGKQGFEAVTPLFEPAFVQGTVMADGLNMRTSASLSAPVVRQTALGTQLPIVCWVSGPSVTATWPNGQTYSTTVWDAVMDHNATSITDGQRVYVSDAWIDTGGDTATMIGSC
jgi:hypothetical protein